MDDELDDGSESESECFNIINIVGRTVWTLFNKHLVFFSWKNYNDNFVLSYQLP